MALVDSATRPQKPTCPAAPRLGQRHRNSSISGSAAASDQAAQAAHCGKRSIGPVQANFG